MAKTIFRCWSVFLLLAVVGLAHGAERVLKVGVIHHSPPMSYVDASGGLTGFNVEVMRELCKELAARCETVVLTLDRVVDTVAAGEVDFAAVSLLVTPERRARLLLTKPYYRSISVWFARPGVKPGEARVAVVKGGIQARYAQARGWAQLPFDNHEAIFGALATGQAQATLLPMANAVALQQDPRMSAQGLASTVVQDPELAGDAALGVNPRDRALLDKLNDAIDEIKRDGRFDRINTRFIPFRLQ